MVAQRGKTAMGERHGDKLRQAILAHRTDETEYPISGFELPPGIEGGVAQITDVKIDYYKKGDNANQPFFMATAAVKEPITHSFVDPPGTPPQTWRVVGRQAKLGPIPLCDTPGRSKETLEEHIADVLNELRKLGLVTADFESMDDIKAACTYLTKEKPHTRFRTWKGEKQTEGPYKDREPQVRCEWLGRCEYAESSVNGQQIAGVVDDTVSTPVPFDETDNAQLVNTAGGEETVGTAASEEVDYEGLIAAATAEDDKAQAELVRLAKEAGMTEAEIDDAKSWEEVVDRIHGGGEPSEPETPTLKVGSVKKYRPPDAKRGGKPSLRAVEVEVTALASGVADLKSLDNPKVTYKGVKVDVLE
jgi:hypothetical protein